MHKLSALESFLHASPSPPVLLGLSLSFFQILGDLRGREVSQAQMFVALGRKCPPRLRAEDLPEVSEPAAVVRALLPWLQGREGGCRTGQGAETRELAPNYRSSRGLSSDSFAEQIGQCSKTTGCFSESLLEGDFASWRSLV